MPTDYIKAFISRALERDAQFISVESGWFSVYDGDSVSDAMAAIDALKRRSMVTVKFLVPRADRSMSIVGKITCTTRATGMNQILNNSGEPWITRVFLDISKPPTPEIKSLKDTSTPSKTNKSITDATSLATKVLEYVKSGSSPTDTQISIMRKLAERVKTAST